MDHNQETQVRFMDGRFRMSGIRQTDKVTRYSDRPVFSAVILLLILSGCLFCGLVMTKDPAYLDLEHANMAPCREFLFGTDTMGRDMFSMIWYGGRISLGIGLTASCLSAAVAVLYGTLSASAPAWLDAMMMRVAEILYSVPGMLFAILLQGVLGTADVVSIAFVIGITGWMSMAKIVRTQVCQIQNQEYILAARCMGGSFFYVMVKHLLPNLLPSILYMAVMNIRSAIAAEAALSFMGMGLPIETVSWGSMLSLSEKALLGSSWWVVVFPGVFLTVTLVCITNLGNYVRKRGERRERML